MLTLVTKSQMFGCGSLQTMWFGSETESRCGFFNLFFWFVPPSPVIVLLPKHSERDCVPRQNVPRAVIYPTTLKISFSVYKSVIDPSAEVPPCQDPLYAHREVSFWREPLGKVVEGIWLGADWVAITMDLVEQVSRLVQAVITDVHILLFYTLRPSCRKEHSLY